MPDLKELLVSLSSSHRAALIWFIEHRGQEIPCPGPMPDGTFLVSRPKGIQKPAGWRHALSVRQMMNGPYADAEPALQENGSWHYQYFQEGTDPSSRDRYFTNVGLMACIEDGVPVGVLRQTSEKPSVRYEVTGLAWVQEWRDDGYFTLTGLSPAEENLGGFDSEESSGGTIVPGDIGDARRRSMSAIVQRQGQSQFRARLLNAYGGRCAITGCDAASALEAAQIVPYRGPATNEESNGLLLRGDIHTLFDLGPIGVDADTMTVILSPALLQGTTRDLTAGVSFLPSEQAHQTSTNALRVHRRGAAL